MTPAQIQVLIPHLSPLKKWYSKRAYHGRKTPDDMMKKEIEKRCKDITQSGKEWIFNYLKILVEDIKVV